MTENEISGKVIGCAIEVHRQLGPGLLESVYEEALCYELAQAGLRFCVSRAFQSSIRRCCWRLPYGSI
ncbi:MAG: GxxExxY protein [Planctomycetales bacterium]|nr:GxxExxY protein [Planctomycetales bacterium]